jgi:hypothetical protein
VSAPSRPATRSSRSRWRSTRTSGATPGQFAIVPDHFIGDIERIVFENDRFAVVAKRAGTPADVVTETDPRS